MRFACIALSCTFVAACGASPVPSPLLQAPPSGVAPASSGNEASPPETSVPSRQPTSTPLATSSTNASPNASPAATLGPTSSPRTGPGYDQIQGLDQSNVTIVQVPDGTRVGFPAFCGRTAVYNDYDETEENVLEFATGSVTHPAGPTDGMSFGSPVISERWIVWASWPETTAKSKELRWVISAVPVEDPAETPFEVASGTNVEPPYPVQPVLAIDGDLLAYTVESAQPGQPQANAIVVHNLAAGADVTRIQTTESVWALDLSGENVIYSEGRQDRDGYWTNTRVMLALGGGTPTEIAKYGYEVAIDGQRLVWTEDTADSYSPTVSGQIVMTATLSNLEPVQLSRQSTASQSYDGYWPAAGEGLVSWHDLASGQSDDHLEVWDLGSGKKVQIFNPTTLSVSSLCGGWIGWYATVESPPGNLFHAFYEAPIDAVKQLFQ